MPAEIRANVEILAEHLEVVRLILGKPLTIRSWYRCPARNKAVGGAPKSIHLTGLAVDLNVRGLSGPQIASRLEAMIRDERIPDGGLGVYQDKPELCHFDVRTVAGKPKSRWVHGGSGD